MDALYLDTKPENLGTVPRQRRQLTAVVQWMYASGQGAADKSVALLRNVRYADTDALITDTLRVELTSRQFSGLGDLPWGTRLTFRADVLDTDAGSVRPYNPRGFALFRPLTVPPEIACVLNDLRQRYTTKDRKGGELWDRNTAIHEIGHGIVADATGGWVDSIRVGSRVDRLGNEYAGLCRAYDVGDELAYTAAGFAAEYLENTDIDVGMEEFWKDYQDFSDELLDQWCRKAIQRFRDEGRVLHEDDSVAREALLLAEVNSPTPEEIYWEWERAVDQALLILLEHRNLFDITLEALEITRLLSYKTLGALGFRELPAEKRRESTERALQERLARMERLELFKDD